MALKRGEVYWVGFDPSVGGDIQKTRPAVIVSNDAANAALNRVLVVPLSTQTSHVYPGEALVELNGMQNKAMADQLTTVSKLRLRSRVGGIEDEGIVRIEAAILMQLGM
jgi:mRNA interferase MazF